MTGSYAPVNTARMNFETWADALDGRATYRFPADQLRGKLKIFDAVVRSSAAGDTPVAI